MGDGTETPRGAGLGGQSPLAGLLVLPFLLGEVEVDDLVFLNIENLFVTHAHSC